MQCADSIVQHRATNTTVFECHDVVRGRRNQRGIERQRLQPTGRGEKMPLISDADIAALATEEEREAAHQMNRRTVFRITSFDCVPE